MLQVTSYAPGLQPNSLTAYLEFQQRLYPLSTTFIQKSSVLESSLRNSSKQGPGSRPIVALDSEQIRSLTRIVGTLTPLGVERFLAALSGAALEHSCSEVEQVVQLLKLAEWFGAHELRDRCDSRLCQLLHGVGNRQQVSDSREEAAAQALEAGVQHYLTKTVGWLLPWALQQLSRGDKDCPGSAAAEQLSGELFAGAAHTAWFLDRAARRRRRLHAALLADDQLKVLLMEQQWWAQGDDFEGGCAECGCSPADLRPAYDCTGDAWVWSRDGESYRAAAAHFAHLLHERCWGLTPAGSSFGSGPINLSPRGEPAPPLGLHRQGSLSSVGQRVQ